jgi:hypothetical protein
VGTETQIITPQIYASADQNKFVGVVSEVGADGNPFKPTYYASRIHIDLSNEDTYAENFEQLLRWIFNKPVFPKPALGKPPEFLKEDTVLLPTRSRAQRAVTLLRSASPAALGALIEYLDSLSDNFETLRIKSPGDAQFDEEVVRAISVFLPYRDEFVGVLTAIAKSALPPGEDVVALKRFFERLIPFMFRPPTLLSYSDNWFDNYRFIVHELFLYVVAVFIKHERFLQVDEFLTGGFFVDGVTETANREPLQDFTIFRQHLPTLQHRNQRLQLRRLSVHADLLKERVSERGISLDDLMQADLVLFIRAIVQRANRWWPESLVWSSRRYRPFEVFARAQSMSYFERISKMLGGVDRDQFVELVTQLTKDQNYSSLPRWEFDYLPLGEITGVTKLGTTS